MRRFLFLYTMGQLGALTGAVVGLALLSPTPTPGPAECGMGALPGILVGGAAGATQMTWLGLRPSRRIEVASPAGQQEEGKPRHI